MTHLCYCRACPASQVRRRGPSSRIRSAVGLLRTGSMCACPSCLGRSSFATRGSPAALRQSPAGACHRVGAAAVPPAVSRAAHTAADQCRAEPQTRTDSAGTSWPRLRPGRGAAALAGRAPPSPARLALPSNAVRFGPAAFKRCFLQIDNVSSSRGETTWVRGARSLAEAHW